MKHRIGALIVTNGTHGIVSIVSGRDVLRCLAEDSNAMQKTAQDVITRDVLTCEPDETVEDVVLRMCGRVSATCP